MRQLRSYQSRAIEQCRAALRAGKRSLLLVAPTGAGKSTMAAGIAAAARARGSRVAWFAHRRELVTQGRDTLREFGVRDGVTLTTYQAAAISGQAPEADVVIFDEAHHLGDGGDWSRVAQAYEGRVRVGLSATPERADGRALEGFEQLIVAAQYSELLSAGHIVPCDIMSTGHRLKSREIMQRPVDAYLAHAAGSAAVVFGSTVAQCEGFAADFVASGVAAEVVHAKLADEERDARLARYASGRTKVVVNVAILTEGWDAPHTRTVILARGCGSAGLYIQMTGRALRPHPSKDRALLLDLAGVANEHGSPTEDRVYSLDGTGIQRQGQAAEGFCRVCSLALTDCQCERDERGELVVVGGQLEPWREAMKAEATDKRASRLARWLLDARAKGHKDGAAKFKYKAVYGHWPSAGVLADAEREVRRATP